MLQLRPWHRTRTRDALLQMRLRRLRRSTVGNNRREVQPHSAAIVVGALSGVSGIAKGARLMAGDLQARGVSCCTVDLCKELRIAVRLPTQTDLIATDILPPLPRVIHFNPPHFARALHSLGKNVFDAPVVAYWAWELPSAPQQWRSSLALADEIWVPSPFVRDALLQRFHADPALPLLRVVPHAISPTTKQRDDIARQSVREKLGLSTTNFVAGFSFSMLAGVQRKNPQGLLKAFRLAFTGAGDEAHLLLRGVDIDKDVNTWNQLCAEAAGDSRIHLIDGRDLSIDDFYASIDVLTSLHRSEGYGLMLAEALSIGIPVLATAWGLSEPIRTHALFTPVSSTLIPVSDPDGPYRPYTDQHWAEPVLNSAIKGIRELESQWRYAGASRNSQPPQCSNGAPLFSV